MNDIKVILDDGEISYGQLTVGTVTTGEAGTEATVTNKGTSSRAILDFTIPRGEKGEKGDTGEQGIQGIAGKNGVDGKDGVDGKTPVKGVDYFTEQEKEQITNEVIRVVGSGGGFTTLTDTDITLTNLTAGEYMTADRVNIKYYDGNGKLQTISDLSAGTYIKVSSGNYTTMGMETLTSQYYISTGTQIYQIVQMYIEAYGMAIGMVMEVASKSYVEEKLGDIETLLSEV